MADGKHLVFLGPPNSGKGTQAARLAEHLGIPAISTGEMLRAAVAAGNELGKTVDAVMKSGELVNDELMAEVVRERLAQDDASNGFILDGYPRTGSQADTLDEILQGIGASVDRVLLVEAPEDVLVERALGRGRADDSEEVVRERLRVYAEKTAPLIARYDGQGDVLARIDGHQGIDAVHQAILAAVES
ncbi:MAG: adenylate kinase [Acidobacteriota bacterium]